jgi:aconitase A
MVSNIRQTQQKHSIIKANYVTSPPLVLAYALAGNVLFDLEQETFGLRNAKISIRDIWPNRQEIEEIEDEIIIKKILNQFNERVQVKKTSILMKNIIEYFRLAIHNGIH